MKHLFVVSLIKRMFPETPFHRNDIFLLFLGNKLLFLLKRLFLLKPLIFFVRHQNMKGTRFGDAKNVYVCDRDDTVKLRLKMSAKDSLLIHPLFFFGGILAVLLLFCRIFFGK